MNLTIDIGNTQMKAGLFDNDDLAEIYVYDDLEKFDIAEIQEKYAPTHTIVSSVVEKKDSLKSIFENVPSLIVLTEETELPIKNLYETPDTLGNDRIAAVVGAHVLCPGVNTLVIDAGTCITFDLINKQGEYLGGNISPGINMRFSALHTFTSRLPLISIKEKFDLIGRSTDDSIVSGVLKGIVAELKGMIENYKQDFQSLQVVITGGDTIFFETQLKNEIFAVPNLVLIGLNKILSYNVQLLD